MRYKRIDATTRPQAVQTACAIEAQCVLSSFDGVSWIEEGQERRVTWDEARAAVALTPIEPGG